jgi:hypothetical protein
MNVNYVYCEVWNEVVYRISIGFVFQLVGSKFSMVYFAASNTVLVFEFILEFHFVSPTIDIGIILQSATFTVTKHLPTITCNIKIQTN